jgi:hypothetical protein
VILGEEGYVRMARGLKEAEPERAAAEELV